MNSFDIVIVNWNAGAQLKECVESVFKSKQENCILKNIIVIDNASDDDSMNQLELLQRDKLTIVENETNLGFGKACNIGAEYASGDFILFLNPDMLVFENTFFELFNYLEDNDTQEVGVYGIQLLDETGNIQRSCARFPSLWNFAVKTLGLNKISKIFKSYHIEEWDHNTNKIVDHVIGAFYFIKTDLFKDLRGFDERYFVYMEDLDLSNRVYKKGRTIQYISQVQAFHKGGGTSENIKAKRIFYSTKSRIIYAIKHFGIGKGMALMLFTFIMEPITRILFLIIKGNFLEIFETLKGFGYLYSDSWNIIKLGMKSEK